MTEQVVEQVPEVVAEVAVPEGTETQAEAEARVDRDEKGKFRNPHQPRIDELTRKHRESEREAAYWKGIAEGKQAKEAEAAQAKAAEKPTPDKFDDYNAYVEALAEWKADQKIEARLSERDKQAAEKEAATKRTSTWSERAAETAKDLPDYHERMSASTVHVASHVTDILLESEIGPRVAYYLDQNPDIADKLNDLSPSAAAREIGRIEAGLLKPTVTTDPEPETAEVPAATPRKAPPPPAKPIGSVRNVTTPLAKTGMDDYITQRKAQGARWAR